MIHLDCCCPERRRKRQEERKEEKEESASSSSPLLSSHNEHRYSDEVSGYEMETEVETNLLSSVTSLSCRVKTF